MIKQFKYFHCVVEKDNFTLAAEEYNISQSAISQQIKYLEKELGFLLFDRSKRKCVLTQAGKLFYQKSLALVDEYERICNECKQIAQEESKN